MRMKRLSVVGWVGILASILFVLASCGGGGGGSDSSSSDGPPPPPSFSPTLGFWSGDGISFTLREGSILVEDFSVTVSGEATGTFCNPSYSQNFSLGSSIEVIDNAFFLELPVPAGGTKPGFTINGTFTSATNAEIEVSWSSYDSNCDAWLEGSAIFPANHESASYLITKDAYMQYRTYPDPANNRYQAWIPVAKVDGSSVLSTDVVDFQILNSAGNVINPTSSQFYLSTRYIFYNCSTEPCSSPIEVNDSGFTAQFSDVPAGTYRYEVEAADGTIFGTYVYYPGRLELPIISPDTATGVVNENGDIVMTWVNPTSDANWNEVDQLRIIFFAADSSTELLYVRVNPIVETVTIPASVVSQVESLGLGKIVFFIIQTRAYDVNNMNYARGYSNN